MADEKMPATEVETGADERSHYEFAFHILPTIAEEEVPRVFGDIKTLIDREGGHITHEEAPQRFDLAYEVVVHQEGRNTRYEHSHFGWVRFLLEPGKLAHLKTEIDHESRVFRHLIVKLSKGEVERPFKLFEAKRKERKAEGAGAENPDVKKEVSEEEIEKSLSELTA